MAAKKRLFLLVGLALVLGVAAMIVTSKLGGPGGDAAYSSELSKQVPVAPPGSDQGVDPNARILSRGEAPSQAQGETGGGLGK